MRTGRRRALHPLLADDLRAYPYPHRRLAARAGHRIPRPRNLAGDHITTLDGHPSLKIASLLETHKHAINDILKESLEHEKLQLENYKTLLKLVEGHSVFLEEYAR